MVRGPAYGPLVDIVKLAATPWAPVLVALSIFEELAALPHSSRDGSVVSSDSPPGTRGSPSKIDEIGTM